MVLTQHSTKVVNNIKVKQWKTLILPSCIMMEIKVLLEIGQIMNEWVD